MSGDEKKRKVDFPKTEVLENPQLTMRSEE